MWQCTMPWMSDGLDEPVGAAPRRGRLEVDLVLAHLGREVGEPEVPVEIRLAS